MEKLDEENLPLHIIQKLSIDDIFSIPTKKIINTKHSRLLIKKIKDVSFMCNVVLKVYENSKYKDLLFYSYLCGIIIVNKLCNFFKGKVFFTFTHKCYIEKTFSYLSLQYIDQSISLRKFLILHQSSLDNVRYNQFLSIFFQIVIALGIAQERCFFTHWDLHIDNVILFFTKQPRKVCHKLYNYKCCFSSNYNIVPYMVDYEYSHGIHTGSNQRISFSFWNQYNSRKTYFRSSLVRKLYSCGILGTFISSVDILRLLCSIQWFCILLLKKKTIYSQGKNTLLYRVYFFVNFLLRKAFGLSFSYRQKHHLSLTIQRWNYYINIKCYVFRFYIQRRYLDIALYRY